MREKKLNEIKHSFVCEREREKERERENAKKKNEINE